MAKLPFDTYEGALGAPYNIIDDNVIYGTSNGKHIDSFTDKNTSLYKKLDYSTHQIAIELNEMTLFIFETGLPSKFKFKF